VHKDFQGFYKMRTPIPGHAYNENLMSLLPLLAHVVLGTIETCNELVLAFGKQIALPPELAPGYRVFVRGPHNEALGWMRSVREGGSPWWCDRIRGDRSSLLGPQHSSTH
jgi:hypothetical protein